MRHLSLNALALVTLVVMALATTGCTPTYPKCHKDDHCQTDGRTEWCVGSFCKQCRDDSHCSATNACMQCGADRTCTRKPKCCLSDVDCPGEKCWKDSPNLPGECGDVCLKVVCPTGQKCVGGACVPVQQCIDNTQCPAGHRCENGTCVKVACTVETIYFDYKEAAVKLDMEKVIQANAECLKQLNAPHVVIGHCDERGDAEFNLALGQRRASAVLRQYKTLGVSAGLLTTISYGKEKPSCSESNETCWNRNRRVETAVK
jgi:Cys-rich repeat protein